MSKGWVFKVLLAFDVFLCVVIFRDPDVTISAETGLALQRASPPRWAKILGGFLNRLSKNHCANAVLHDIARAQAAVVYLTTKQA